MDKKKLDKKNLIWQNKGVIRWMAHPIVPRGDSVQDVVVLGFFYAYYLWQSLESVLPDFSASSASLKKILFPGFILSAPEHQE